MQVGAIGGMSYFTPYIYNTNNVNRASMNKISAIGDDVAAAKTDFSELTQETTNPLKRGESLDFAGILGMQMQMSRMNAARFIKEPEEVVEASQAAGVKEDEAVAAVGSSASKVAEAVNVPVTNAIEAVEPQEQSAQTTNPYDFARAMAAYQPFEMYA